MVFLLKGKEGHSSFLVTYMDCMEIINAVVGANDQGRCKTTLGFIVEKANDESEDSLLDEFFVEKPIVQISDFIGDDKNEYFCFEFVYKSRRDEDLKQQWSFAERYVARLSNTEQATVDLPVLTVSMIPKSMRGKYSILAKAILPDSIIKIEYAGDNVCSIRMLALKENVLFLEHDDDVIDSQSIEAEVIREIDDELAEEFGTNEDNV